jgi:hypothetical protein
MKLRPKLEPGPWNTLVLTGRVPGGPAKTPETTSAGGGVKQHPRAAHGFEACLAARRRRRGRQTAERDAAIEPAP